ncbi:MAG: anthranilate phosphoribosyltransferase [Candidatus Eisenbacteria bacterium]
MDLPGAIARLVDRQDLTRAQARAVLAKVMAGEATPAQIAAFLIALRMKGETAEEIAGAAEAMRAAAIPIRAPRRPVLDTCGTGGDGRGTWNLSTAAALVVAGGGAAVAKHGNRAISSRSGSADVLEALGVVIDLDPDGIEACLGETGFAFLFAPRLHPAMRHALGPRREIAVRSLFNLLGPLTNPAGVDRQVLGVFAAPLVPTVAGVLHRLGTEHALVVHGAGGEDELSLDGEPVVFEARSGAEAPRPLAVSPRALGFDPPSDPAALSGGDARANAAWITGLLAGEVRGPSREAVVLNAAAGFYVTGLARDLAEGCARSRESLDSGAAASVLDRLRETSRKLSRR